MTHSPSANSLLALSSGKKKIKIKTGICLLSTTSHQWDKKNLPSSPPFLFCVLVNRVEPLDHLLASGHIESLNLKTHTSEKEKWIRYIERKDTFRTSLLDMIIVPLLVVFVLNFFFLFKKNSIFLADW